MALIRRNDPLAGITNMHRELDDIFSNIINQPTLIANDNQPAMDVYIEDDDRLVAEIQLSGFSPEDVEIRVTDNVLEIIGEKREEEEHRDRRRSYMLHQSISSFYRSLVLPREVDQENLDANFEDGVLRIEAPLKQDRPQRRVNIRGRNADRATTRRRSTSRAQTRSEEDQER
jgi:HSP20 family protein